MGIAIVRITPTPRRRNGLQCVYDLLIIKYRSRASLQLEVSGVIILVSKDCYAARVAL